MNILFDLCHPAHVHFFKWPIRQLTQKGHHVVITSRNKECTQPLLDQERLHHWPLNTFKKGNLGKLIELGARHWHLRSMLKHRKIDLLVGLGGTVIAHVGYCLNIPTLIFYDGDNATVQNAVTYPFADTIVVPYCYQGRLPEQKSFRYSGFHELAYLHPNVYSKARLPLYSKPKGKKRFLIRLVSFDAIHDYGKKGINLALLTACIQKLAPLGDVVISSESPLPLEYRSYTFKGLAHHLHHLIAECDLFIGDSPTMASEACMLGCPALYCSTIKCGNMQMLDTRYHLLKQVYPLNWSTLNQAIDAHLKVDTHIWQSRHQHLLSTTIDVAHFVTQCIDQYPSFIHHYQDPYGPCVCDH